MPEVRASLELDLADALSEVDTLGESLSTSLDESVSSFVAAFDAGLAQISSDISALGSETVDVGVTADTAEAQASISGLEGEEVDIPVEADTAAAQESISALGDTAADTSGGISELTSATAGFGAASDLATGSAAGLGSAVGDLSAGAATVVGVIGAVAVTLGSVFEQALDAQAATERFNMALGGMAASVNQINVGDLNVDLSSLALSLGSDDDALRQAAASFFQLGTAAGASRSDIGAATEQIIALSARAVALNPTLGDVAGVSETMGRALSRGGRFAAQFGIDLSAADINARALADTGKSTTAELTFYEKAAAGAALATEKYGDSLDSVISGGAQNAQITFARLKQTLQENLETIGAPVVAPILDLMQDMIPIATSVAQILTTLGGSALPILSIALEALAPVLQFVADALDAIPGPILSVILTFITLEKAVMALASVFPALSAAISSNPIGALVTVVALAATAVGLFGGSTASAADEIKTLSGELKNVPADEAARKFLDAEVSVEGLTAAARQAKGELVGFGQTAETAAEIARAAFRDARNDIRLLAEESPGAARNVVEGLRAMGAESGFTKAQLDILETAVKNGTGKFRENAAAAREIAAVDKEVEGSATGAATAIDAFVTAAIGKLPTLGSVLDTTEGQLGAFKVGLDNAASPEQFLANLNAMTQGIVGFQGNLQTTVSLGFTNVAQFVAEQGPVVGGAYLQAFLAAPPAVQQATDQALFAQQTAGANYAAYLNGPFAGIIAGGYHTAVDPLAGISAGAFAQVDGAIQASGPSIAGSAGAVGAGATGGLAGGVAPMPTVAGAAAQGIGPVLQQLIPFVSATARSLGTGVGEDLAIGISRGIQNRAGEIAAAAAQVVRDAVAAARAEAAATSPSKVMMALGADMGTGLAVGLSASTRAVVAEAEAITRAAANAARTGIAGSFGATPGTAGGLHIDTIKVDVVGVDDPVKAKLAGMAAARGIVAELDGASRRRLSIGART